MKLLKEIERIFPKVEKILTEERLAEFLRTPYADLDKYDFGLGTMIKLKLLKPKNKIYLTFVENGIADRDIMAKIIIRDFHKSRRSPIF